ncbi:MAG TPA: hypothetical protein VNH44_13415 [Micropepsaceae bacterium]|nr:hypothetical protein [Micropepsaceae bacterium]
MGAKKTSLAREIEDLNRSIKKIRDPVLRKLVIHLIGALGLYYAEREKERTLEGRDKTR